MIWIIIMLGSSLFFALNHISKKKLLENTNVLDMMIAVGILSFILTFPLIKFVEFQISYKNIFLIALNSAFAFSGSFLLNIAYKNCEISSVSPLLNVNPLFVIVFSYFILGELINTFQMFGVLLILIGGYIVTLGNIRFFFRPFTSMPKKYFLFVLSTLLLWSFCPILNRVVLLEIDACSYMFFYAMSLLFIQIPLLLLKKRIKNILHLVKKKWQLIFIISFFWVISDFLHIWALSIPTAVVSLAMPVKRISNLFTIILGGKMFNEKNLLVKSTACVFMLAGFFIIGLNTI